MRLNLKTKFTLATSLVVLFVVALVSSLYLARLTTQTIKQADDRAGFIAQQVFDACQQALKDSADHGEAPSSESSEDIRAYVQNSLDNSSALDSLLSSAVGYSPTVYEITVLDQKSRVMISSDPGMRDKVGPRHTDVSVLGRASFLEQVQVLYGPQRIYELSLPFKLGAQPFGDIRVGLSSTLLRAQVAPDLRSAGWVALTALIVSTLLAALLSSFSLAPLTRISNQLDQISAGRFDIEPVERADELGLVSNKISKIGKQLRDVREVFSNLRENLNQVMSGLEDGLMLFNADGRAVLVSPSVSRFLGVEPGTIMGRRSGEIFALGHPLREALRMAGNRMEPIEDAEVRLDSPDGPRRVAISAQAISERGELMGTLLTLRDVESYERLGSQLQVSERLAALGRVTAGVAHEVKNPLNSMRVWLEVLKGNLPAGGEPQQAVRMLDNEIDRLDRAVKTFLDFTRPVQIEFEDSDLPALLQQVLEGARPALQKAGITIKENIPKKFPPVRMDRGLMHQCVLNLILNASEAMKPNGGTLTVALHELGNQAEIGVSDTGKGIAPENRAKIFQLFFTTRPGGTGIGLANTFRFVQLHNGSIEFESELGHGTTFRIELPLEHSSESLASKLPDLEQSHVQGKA